MFRTGYKTDVYDDVEEPAMTSKYENHKQHGLKLTQTPNGYPSEIIEKATLHSSVMDVKDTMNIILQIYRSHDLRKSETPVITSYDLRQHDKQEP